MARVTFYDLLGVASAPDPRAAAAALWPRSRVKSTTGYSIDADPSDLMRYLQDALEFRSVRPGADGARVGLVAEVTVNNAAALPVRPLVLTQMPDVAFYLQNTAAGRPARLFATRSDTGVEIVIEGLPVEIRLPHGLLMPSRDPAEEEANPGGGPDETPTDPFRPGVYDSLQVTLSDAGESSIFVHVRVRMTEEMDVIIEPAVPIAIGPCRFNGVPCLGLHDLGFVPSPRLQGDHIEGEQALEWTRHRLDRLAPDAAYAGVLTVRTVELDSTRPPLKELAEKLNAGRAEAERVEFVLEDIALPFVSIAGLPIPAHGLFGLRRRIELGNSPEEAYRFAGAPVQIALGDWRLLIEELMLRTPVSAADQFIFFKLALVFGSTLDATHAATLAVTDEWTIQAGWRSPAGLTLFTIADATLKLWGAKVGWSIKRFASKDPQYAWHEQLQLLVDLGLSTKGTSAFSGAFQMRSLSGKDLEVVLRDVGWNLGEFSLEGVTLPEGVQFIFARVVRLLVEEMGWITENNGGRYFTFSGGVSIFTGAGEPNRSPTTGAGSAAVSEEKGKGGGIRFHRLRFLTGGNPNAPAWLMDGVTVALRLGRFAITGFGMVSEFTEGGHEYKEFGFGIQVEFDALAKHFLIGMQLFYGRVRGPADNFTYWMFGFQISPIPIGTFELVNVRMLLAGNMAPNLPAADGHDQNMRLFRWYKSSGNAAITLPANRKLASWRRRDHSFAAGLGAGMRLPVGDLIVLDVFLFFHKSPEEAGLLIAAEVYALRSPKPIGYAAFEYDFERDKWGFMIGVSLGLEHLFGIEIPVLSDLVSLSGNLYAGNKPATFALGQLNDQATWLTFRFEMDAFIEVGVLVAVCLQLVDRPEGPKGFGLVASIKGGASFGIGKFQVYAGFGLIMGVWRNESKAFGLVVWIEAGFRIKLFWIFTFGARARVEFDYLGDSAAYRRLGCEITIETPWFLPDITFRFEKIWDEPHPERLDTISTPLIAAAALEPGRQAQRDLAVSPITGGAIDTRAVYSMDQLRALGAGVVPAGALTGLTPIAVDSVIGLSFKPSMDDRLSVGEITPAGAGTQRATAPAGNDLSATYELVEVAIRRRPRFGRGAGVWTTLLAPGDTRLETPADLPPGTGLAAHFTSSVSFRWNRDLVREDQLDPRLLLINARTPYTFLTSDPEADESTARSEPGWPCCAPRGQEGLRWHELDFMATPFGVRAPSFQTFSDSSSMLHWAGPKPPIVAPGIAAPGGWHAARVHVAGRHDGVFATISLDEPAAVVEMDAYWLPGNFGAELIVESYDGLAPVHRQVFPLTSANPSPPIRLEAREGITSVLLGYADGPKPGGDAVAPPQRTDWIEFTRMRYRTVREVLDAVAHDEKCKAQNQRALSGGGTLAWLPNHDYEISLTTKVTLDHAKTGKQEARIEQQAVFRTKGLPGLNAVARIGDELEPFVESRYPAPAPCTLYRAEPVALAFNERFNVLLPVDRARSPANPDELNQVLEWVLAVEKVGGATGGQRVSQTSPDWIVGHRTVPPVPVLRAPVVLDGTIVHALVRDAVTRDPFQVRFEAMLHGPFGCALPGPSLHRSQVLLHEPVDPAAAPGASRRWEANAEFRVNVRRKDGPFVERNPFDDNDFTAFTFSSESRVGPNGWTVTDGVMRLVGAPAGGQRSYAIFGEDHWNHVQIHAAVDPEGGIAGVAVGVTAGVPAGYGVTRAVAALVDEGAARLRLIERRDAAVHELGSVPLPAGAAAPYVLELIAFDDRLRARVGDAVVEAARDDVREGRLALVAQGGGAFAGLVVEPLDAYRFQFRSSRFVDFADHIGSFDGDVTAIPVDAAGPGAATETAASLLVATGAQIGAAMTAGADPEVRQRLFDRWVRGLGLPLRRQADGFELSRLVGPGGADLLLLESPEPLPFSEDLTVALRRRVPAMFVARPRPPDALAALVAGLDFDGERVVGSVASDDAVRVLARTRRLVRPRVIDGAFEYHVYDVRLQRGRRGGLRLAGEVVEIVRPRGRDSGRGGSLTRELAGMGTDEVALLDGTGRRVIPDFIPFLPAVDVSIPVRVLTDGSELRALVLPVDQSSGTLAPLADGTYRLDFCLDRARFRVQTPDAASNYRAEAWITARW